MNVNLLNFRKLITGNKIIFNFVLFICMNFFISSSNTTRQYEFRCPIVGPSGAGKTTIFCSLMNKECPSMYTQSTYVEYGVKNYISSSDAIKVTFWDTPGGEKYNLQTRITFVTSDIIMIIIPVDSDQPLDVLKKYLEDIKTISSTSKCIIVLNKVDITTKTEEDIEKLKTECGEILNTNGLEGEVVFFSAKLENYKDDLNNEIKKMLLKLIKEKEPLKKGKELLKKDDSDTGNDSYDDSSQVIKPIPNVLDITDHAKKKSKQKKPITNTKKSDSNDNGNEYTNQKQNCISCRAK